MQSVAVTMPTADKLRWIDALVASGLREIEVCSFVSPRLLPQMADATEVVRHALAHPALVVMALVPNLRGTQGALQAGAHSLAGPAAPEPLHGMTPLAGLPQAWMQAGATHG